MNETLIHPDQAIALMLSMARSPSMERVPLALALGRALPLPVDSSLDQPPFDKSAMDGWAWRRGDGPALPETPLRNRGTIAAGSAAGASLEPGECARIMTGAPLPPGADRVQRVEWSTEEKNLVRFTRAEGIDNVIRRGENARRGQTLLSPRVLRAQDLAILAADGRDTVELARRPAVGVLSTGTELAEPGHGAGDAMIYDSNRPQLMAQLAGLPCAATDLGRLRDDFDATLAAIRDALGLFDLLILSGGVSMGDYDYVPRALEACGVKALFHGVAMKPGKPTWFGRKGDAFVLGLPGNPVSVFVNAALLASPLILALSGIRDAGRSVPVIMAETVSRKGADRVEFLPVRVDADGARAVPYGGSSALQALAQTDGFARLEIGQESLEAGGVAHVRLVR